MKLRLDEKTVSALALGKGQKELFTWDTELQGFGLRLQGQKKTYVAQDRVAGRTKRSTLRGELTPSQARAAAKKLLARVALGEDPQGEKAAQRRRAERTFAKAVTAYLADKEPTLRPTSYRLAKL